jgi:hypothetical protein
MSDDEVERFVVFLSENLMAARRLVGPADVASSASPVAARKARKLQGNLATCAGGRRRATA